MIDFDKMRLESEPMVEHLVNSFFLIPNGHMLPKRPDLLLFTLAMFNFAVIHGYPTVQGKNKKILEDSFLQIFEELREMYQKIEGK